jgi:hypothetical protein
MGIDLGNWETTDNRQLRQGSKADARQACDNKKESHRHPLPFGANFENRTTFQSR